MSDFSDIFEQAYEEQKDVVYRNLRDVQRADEVTAKVVFQGYKGTWDQSQKKYINQDVCPPTKTGKGKPKTEGGKQTEYRIPIAVSVRLVDLTLVEGSSSVDEEGNFQVVATVDHSQEWNDDIMPFSEWAAENASLLYDDEDTTFDQATKLMFRNYVAPTGEVVTSTKVTLPRGYFMTVECPDDGSKSIFRQKFPGTELMMVQPNTTKLVLNKLKVRVWLYLKKEQDVWVPRFSTKCRPSYVKLAAGEEEYQGMARRMREREDPNAHNMAFGPDVLERKVQVPKSAYFFVQDRRSTPIPVPNLEGRGVYIRVEPPKKLEDLCGTDKEGERYKRFSKTMMVMQWFNDPSNGLDKYAVEMKTSGEELANSFGLLDIDDYTFIMFAHYDVTFHAVANLYWKGTFEDRPENLRENMEKAGAGAAKGYYCYYINKLVPDYKVYFEEARGAMQISRDKCAELFEDFIGTRRKTGEQTLVLRNPGAVNPVNRDGAVAEVILLGRPDANAFNGDAWPMIRNGRVYVMTSATLSQDDRLTLCGPDADLEKADARLDELMETDGFHYAVFVVKDVGSDEKEPTKGKRKKATPKKPTKKTKAKGKADEDEDDLDAMMMELQE